MSVRLQASILYLTSALSLSGCAPASDRLQVIARKASPDGEREAVHARDMSGGATVGPSDEVYVVRRSVPIRSNNRVVGLERICGMDMRWLANDTLAVSYRAKRSQDNRAFLKPAVVNVRLRWLGRDVANGC